MVTDCSCDGTFSSQGVMHGPRRAAAGAKAGRATQQQDAKII